MQRAENDLYKLSCPTYEKIMHYTLLFPWFSYNKSCMRSCVLHITHGQLLLSENWIDNVSKFRMEKQQLACVSYGVRSERMREK